MLLRELLRLAKNFKNAVCVGQFHTPTLTPFIAEIGDDDFSFESGQPSVATDTVYSVRLTIPENDSLSNSFAMEPMLRIAPKRSDRAAQIRRVGHMKLVGALECAGRKRFILLRSHLDDDTAIRGASDFLHIALTRFHLP